MTLDLRDHCLTPEAARRQAARTRQWRREQMRPREAPAAPAPAPPEERAVEPEPAIPTPVLSQKGVWRVSIADIVRASAEHFNAAQRGILRATREEPYTRARKVAMHVCSRAGYARVEIGRALERNHETVRGVNRNTAARLKTDPDLAADVAAVMKALGMVQP